MGGGSAGDFWSIAGRRNLSLDRAIQALEDHWKKQQWFKRRLFYGFAGTVVTYSRNLPCTSVLLLAPASGGRHGRTSRGREPPSVVGRHEGRGRNYKPMRTLGYVNPGKCFRLHPIRIRRSVKLSFPTCKQSCRTSHLVKQILPWVWRHRQVPCTRKMRCKYARGVKHDDITNNDIRYTRQLSEHVPYHTNLRAQIKCVYRLV